MAVVHVDFKFPTALRDRRRATNDTTGWVSVEGRRKHLGAILFRSHGGQPSRTIRVLLLGLRALHGGVRYRLF